MLLQASFIISYPLVNSNWNYSPEMPNLGQNRRFLEPCDLEIWRMTLKNNRAPLLCNIKLYASFHHHMWIQTGVTVRKRLIWILTSVTLTFDLWPWTFAWTSLWSLVMLLSSDLAKSHNHHIHSITRTQRFQKSTFIIKHIIYTSNPGGNQKLS